MIHRDQTRSSLTDGFEYRVVKTHLSLEIGLDRCQIDRVCHTNYDLMNVWVIRTGSHILLDIEIHKDPELLLRLFQGPVTVSAGIMIPFEAAGAHQAILLPSKIQPIPRAFLTALDAQMALIRPRFSTPLPI